MSIANVDPTYLGNGPTVTNEVLAQTGPSGVFASTLAGTGTATIDGSATSFILNFVTGTTGAGVLPFTPSGIIFSRNGGTATATATPMNVTTITTSNATIAFGAAGTSTHTIIFSFLILR